MNESPPPREGWSVLKVLGLAVGVIGMAGFGVCSLCGLVMGVTETSLLSTVLMFAVPGLILAALCFVLARKMVRMARAPRA